MIKILSVLFVLFSFAASANSLTYKDRIVKTSNTSSSQEDSVLLEMIYPSCKLFKTQVLDNIDEEIIKISLIEGLCGQSNTRFLVFRISDGINPDPDLFVVEIIKIHVTKIAFENNNNVKQIYLAVTSDTGNVVWQQFDWRRRVKVLREDIKNYLIPMNRAPSK